MAKHKVALTRDDPETLYGLYYEASKTLAKLGKKLKSLKKRRK
jgi:hypothetical protein